MRRDCKGNPVLAVEAALLVVRAAVVVVVLLPAALVLAAGINEGMRP